MTMPTHCTCGVLLEGGATRHAEDCWIRKLIQENFSAYRQPDPPDVVTMPRKLIEGAIACLRSVLAVREGISDELLGEVAKRLESELEKKTCE